MATRFSSWTLLIIHILLLINCCYGGDETTVLRLHSMDETNQANNNENNQAEEETNHAHADHVHEDHDHANHHHTPSSSSHMEHMDPRVLVFFFLEDLKAGHKFTIYFPKKDPSKAPQFLPKQEADRIPFSLQDLPQLLTRFHFRVGSPQAEAMRNTLTECQTKPLKTETKTCATSLESMLAFIAAVLGPTFEPVTTVHLTASTVHLQNYTVTRAPVAVPAKNTVACHSAPYPYAVYYCHSQVTENRLFRVALEGDNGDLVDAVAMCHMDTSLWTPDHVSFRVLGTSPGKTPVCHFFPADNIIWIPK